MRYLFVLLFLGMIGCKTQEKVVTKNHFVSDTIIEHKSEVVTLPTRTITVIDKPCKNDTIKIFQQIKSGDATLTLSSDKENNLVIDFQLDSLKQVVETLEKKSKEVKEVTVKETIIKYKTPKWNWYIMGALLILVVWAYRGVILGLIKRLIKPI